MLFIYAKESKNVGGSLWGKALFESSTACHVSGNDWTASALVCRGQWFDASGVLVRRSIVAGIV